MTIKYYGKKERGYAARFRKMRYDKWQYEQVDEKTFEYWRELDTDEIAGVLSYNEDVMLKVVRDFVKVLRSAVGAHKV